jgi:hypothetical protein
VRGLRPVRYPVPSARRYCMDAGGRPGKNHGMAPRLTDFELETCARALRALAYHEGSSAEKISDPALRVPVQKRAQCAQALAERFEAARRGRKA